MTVQTVSETNLPPNFMAAHGHMLGDASLQFSFSPVPPPPQPPAWLKEVEKYLEPIAKGIAWIINTLGPLGPYIFWGAVAAIAGVVLFFILRALGYVNWRLPVRTVEAEEDWVPETSPARKLLAEADALAAAGQFEKAAHLLLLRSFEDIANRRPHLLKPATTAREMAHNTGLPDAARAMFAQISRHVEASLFGGDALNAAGWGDCRAAYTRFALPGDWL